MSIKPLFRIRLYTLFICILLIVLLLPLSSLYLFRIYENELVHQTETELIAQGLILSSLYRQEVGIRDLMDKKYSPVIPTLDLRHTAIRPTRDDGILSDQATDPAAEKAANKILPIMISASRSTLSSMRILDRNGIVVAGTNEMGMDFSHIEEVHSALKGQYTSLLRQRRSKHPNPAFESISRGSSIRVFVAMPVMNKDSVAAVIYLSRSPRNILKALYDERSHIIPAVGFILLITALIAWALSYFIGRPLRLLTHYSTHLNSQEQTDRLPTPIISEFALLTESIQSMVSTIQSRSNYISNFAMHLAHEFKTPLTSIRGAMELLRDHIQDMSHEQRDKFMSNITHDTNRLDKLVSRLLDLARADSLQPGAEATRLTHVLTDLQNRYPAFLPSPSSKDITLKMGEDVLETLLINLIENSLQHGATSINLTAETLGDTVEINVIDNGTGISANNARNLFTPFFTTKREKGGTGLGLVIVQSLLKAYNGTITYIERENGAHFKIMLPILV